MTEAEPTETTQTIAFRDRCILLLAEGAGLGRMPQAPGTFGSLWGLVIASAFVWFHVAAAGRLLTGVVMLLAGIPICDRAAVIRKRKDPGSVVWDEIAAFPLVYAFAELDALSIAAGFLAFRFFDIVKPWPIRRLERIGGGTGIMVDDQVAACYAAAAIAVLAALRGNV